MQLSNYMFFSKTCEEALAFYTTCGLGRVTEVKRHGANGHAVPDALKGKVKHARFEGPGILFFASDNDEEDPAGAGVNVLSVEDRSIADRLFGSLADGGVVADPIGFKPWGEYSGKLKDRFGVRWIVDWPQR